MCYLDLLPTLKWHTLPGTWAEGQAFLRSGGVKRTQLLNTRHRYPINGKRGDVGDCKCDLA